LNVAVALLREHGPAALSVRRVADGVGVSRQVVYSRFGDKAGLVRALHDEGFSRLVDEVAAVDAPVGSDEHVVGLAQGYRRAATAAPQLFDVMFGRPFPEFIHDLETRRVALASFEHIVDGARAWLEANGGDAADALTLARTLWATTHGVVALEHSGHLSAQRAALQLDDAIRRLLRGSVRTGGR
jgi:AcrR family transcriptional regulator